MDREQLRADLAAQLRANVKRRKPRPKTDRRVWRNRENTVENSAADRGGNVTPWKGSDPMKGP